MLLIKRKMGPKKGRRMRNIEAPIDTPTEFELRDVASDIHKREETKQTEKGRRR